nr:FeoB-associated Cys-rich membrane protein [Neisseria elongata]
MWGGFCKGLTIIVGVIMLTCVFFLLRKFVFKPKKRDCSSGCSKCGGCG